MWLWGEWSRLQAAQSSNPTKHLWDQPKCSVSCQGDRRNQCGKPATDPGGGMRWDGLVTSTKRSCVSTAYTSPSGYGSSYFAHSVTFFWPFCFLSSLLWMQLNCPIPQTTQNNAVNSRRGAWNLFLWTLAFSPLWSSSHKYMILINDVLF